MSMNILTSDYWRLFKKDGRLFESLMGDVLKILYPDASFVYTSASWDGGKDHEGSLPLIDAAKAKIWAECKYHHSALPIHKVSMTLLMAYIEAAQQVIILSYSPIKQTFMQHVARYKNRTQMSVSVYADSTLEELILKAWPYFSDEKKKEYFPDLLVYDKALLPKHDPIHYVYKLGANLSGKSEVIVQLNDYIHLELFIINTSDENVSIQVELKDTQMDYPYDLALIGTPNFEVHKCKAIRTIHPHTSEVMTFVVHFKNYSQKIKLPELIVSDQQGTKHYLRINRKIRCRWLAETGLIGQQYISCIEKCEEIIGSADHMPGILIFGGSGVGKSRLMKELEYVGHKYDKKTCYIDSEHAVLTARDFIRQVISAVEGLPYFNDLSDDKFLSVITEKNTSSTKQFAFRLLYDMKLDLSLLKDEITGYLIDLLKRCRCLILLDNVQNYDEVVTSILSGIVGYIGTQNLSTTIVFSFNTEKLYRGTAAFELFNRLKLIGSHSTQRIFAQEICGFQIAEATQYIMNCLTFSADQESDNISYDLAIKKIISVCGTNPFYLQNFLLFLEQQRIIKKTATTSFYICNVVRFQEALNKIPPNIHALLDERENELLKHLAKQPTNMSENYRIFVSLMCLAKALPRQLFSKMVFGDEILYILKDIGFITEIDGSIVFSHQFIEEMIRDKYPLGSISETILQKFILVAENSYLADDLTCSIFLARYLSNAINESTFNAMVDKIIMCDVSSVYSSVIFRAIAHLVQCKQFPMSLPRQLDLYNGITNMTIGREGIEKSLPYYKYITNSFISHPSDYSQLSDRLDGMLREYIAHLLNIGSTIESISTIEAIINTFQAIGYEQSTIPFLNFMVIAYTYRDQLENAITTSDRAINIANRNHDIKDLVNIWLMRGDIYYGLYEATYKEKIQDCWRHAFLLFSGSPQEEESHATLSQKIEVYKRIVLCELMDNNIHKAEDYFEHISGYLDRTNMMYFEIKLRLLRTMLLIFYPLSPECLTEGSKLTKEAIDICAVYGNMISYLDCFQLLAALQMRYAKYDQSSDNYMKALEILLALLSSSNNFRQREYFFLDIAITFRRMGKIMPAFLYRNVPDPNVYNAMIEIQKMPDCEWHDYLEQHAQLTAVFEPTCKLNMPKI